MQAKLKDTAADENSRNCKLYNAQRINEAVNINFCVSSAWVTLGKPRSGNPKAYTESGFQGKLTKVQIWSRALDVTGEIQKQVRDCRTEPVLYRGLVLTWAGYEETVGGVERIVPSQCGQRNCPPGYSGAKCQNLEVDKVIDSIYVQNCFCLVQY